MWKWFKTLLAIACFCVVAFYMIKLNVTAQRWMLGLSDDRARHLGMLGKCDMWEVMDGDRRTFIAYCEKGKTYTLETRR